MGISGGTLYLYLYLIMLPSIGLVTALFFGSRSVTTRLLCLGDWEEPAISLRKFASHNGALTFFRLFLNDLLILFDHYLCLLINHQ